MKNKMKLRELFLSYEQALTDYGLSCAARLNRFQSASRVI
jgi:hypothetical protein